MDKMTVDTREPQSGELAQIADAGAAEYGDVDQPTLDGKAMAAGPVVKFNGVKATEVDEDEVKDWKVNQPVHFHGKGIIVHVGDDLNQRDGTIRKVIVVKVDQTTVSSS